MMLLHAFPTDWLTPCVRQVDRGLEKCHDRSFRFRNFIRSPILLKISNRESAAIEFAQSAFLSVLFALRGPSETLQLRMEYSSDNLLAFPPHPDKALIGISAVGDELFLAAKFAWRKNITGGRILRRPCFCDLGDAQAVLLCPVHCFWPAVRRRVAPGQLLFRMVNVGNFNRMMEDASPKMLVPEAHRFSSHGFRRGKAQELRKKGPPWTAVAAAGLWNSAACRGYVDMSRDVEFGVSRLFAADPDSESYCALVQFGLFSLLVRPLAGRPGRIPLCIGRP